MLHYTWRVTAYWYYHFTNTRKRRNLASSIVLILSLVCIKNHINVSNFSFNCQTHFRKLKRGKIYCIYPPFTLSIVPFPSWYHLFYQDSFFYHFLSVSRTSFSHPFWVGLLVTNALSFPSSQNIFICPSFLKEIFNRHRILHWQFFSFNTWIMMCYFLLAFIVTEYRVIQTVWIVLPLKVRSCLFLIAFKIFFIFYFQRFDYGVSWYEFIWIYSVWGLLSFLNM